MSDGVVQELQRVAQPATGGDRRQKLCSGVRASAAAMVVQIGRGSCAVVGYTGVSDCGSGVFSATALTAGCTISSPKKPPRTSPRARSRVPGVMLFCCDG